MAAIRETKLYPPIHPGEEGQSKRLFLVHELLLFERLLEVSDNPFIENTSIKIAGITITNIYIPPEST